MAENKKYIGCKSWLCHQCKHYIKFLTVSSMQDICWNRGCFYESNDEIHPTPTASDGEDQCTCGTFSSRKFCPVHGYVE